MFLLISNFCGLLAMTQLPSIAQPIPTPGTLLLMLGGGLLMSSRWTRRT